MNTCNVSCIPNSTSTTSLHMHLCKQYRVPFKIFFSDDKRSIEEHINR